MPTEIRPSELDGQRVYEIHAAGLRPPFIVVTAVSPDTGQAMTPRGYRDLPNEHVRAAVAAGVPVIR